MIKISALNNESEEESGSEEEVTKEALEQIALQQYAKALDLQRKGNLADATQLLKDLLDTELLYNVKKPAPGEKISSPLFNLKYLCYKNLATMLSAADEVEAAVESYIAASELDDTDVTLWHRFGLLCLRTERYETALYAFQHGVDRNPRHWPCIDKIITLLLGLDYKEECITAIYDALQLDPGYMRGLVYRKHIYKEFPYVRDYMEYLNPIYKWVEENDEPYNEENGKKFLNEANEIHKTFIEQQKAEQFKYILPNLKLKKPISALTWNAVGESLVHMHKYMADNCFSHACFIGLIFEKAEIEEILEVSEIEEKDADTPENKEENNTDNEKNTEIVSENENNDLSDKQVTDTEKVESDVEIIASESAAETTPEPKTQKKTPVRRRGSALSFLEQWEWCNKRRSGRKKPSSKQERYDNNIYDTLRRMVPVALAPEMIQKKENQANETSTDLTNLFEEKDKLETKTDEEYFGTDCEQKDVREFINKYKECKSDIIDILKDYLSFLALKWNIKWSEGLPDIFVEANKCYNTHIDIPACADNDSDLIHYIAINLLSEEISVNSKLNQNSDEKELATSHELGSIESIGLILTSKPHVFESINCLEYVLRQLWVKLHIHILNKCDEFALDCLYQLLCEFEAMGDHHDKYSVNVTNFTFKPLITEAEITEYIKFLERNKKLSTVMELYEKGLYEEVLSIVLDSFEHCKDVAKKQEEEMSLDFAVQLSIILDTFWALEKVDNCFKWSLTCLHEALKHYFRFTSGSKEYEKWTLAVVKVLSCMEHILTNEGLTCLEAVSQKELSQALEDLIRIIGHQVETNATEMPFGTVAPWIIMHYILQREEDQGRGRTISDNDRVACDEVPNPLMILFMAHEQLGNRSWCCISEGKLLYFILDTVVPRLRSPSLAKSLEQVCQYMEQCVYCLFGHPGHPGRKTKLKNLVDHNVTPHSLDWKRAQQIYEIFRPHVLPALEGKVSGITADVEQLFHRILALLPPECDPTKYLPDLEKYIKGIENILPSVPPLLPYKMKDIYFLLGDYHFKNEKGKLAIKFNMLDVILNNDRLESWAEISLSKAMNLERILNSCKNLDNEREFLNQANSTTRCFKRSLDLDPTHRDMWLEYGNFVYTVHSFCSRLLKQASESLSMEDFESLEKQKEDMLDTTYKCFNTLLNELNNSCDTEKTYENAWQLYYMLGKVAEKRNKPPSIYLNFYMQGVRSLNETDATYPLKINYSTPTHLCIEVLELHYRIHASILKYIEQHENKPIPASVGKIFITCIDEWQNGPFTKKSKKETSGEDIDYKAEEPVHAANILKRSVSDAGEEDTYEAKKLKLESAAAKVRRSASYDTERIVQKDVLNVAAEVTKTIETVSEDNEPPKDNEKEIDKVKIDKEVKAANDLIKDVEKDNDKTEKLVSDKNRDSDNKKKEESSSSSSSSSSSDSSSSESSSDSSSDSSRDSDTSTKSSNDNKQLGDEDIMKIVRACLDALEDCASRFPPHYKAIYRLAHYHFYYKKGKDIERCRDLMLSNFMLRCGQKLGGLFSERKQSNFFNNIWKIPSSEVDRAGSFAFHMNRSVMLTMEILKEIDDHKTLLDLSLHLQRIPEPDKKYLRDSEREELAQQAFSLCVQSLKAQLLKFSQQADLKSNEVERQTLKTFMLDIYKAYQRVQKQSNSKQFVNLLVDAYKLITTASIPENANLVDLSMKYCQSMIQILKQQATMASLDKSQNQQKKQIAKCAEVAKATPVPPAPSQPKPDKQPTTQTSASGLPKMSPHEMAAAFQSYVPMLNDQLLSQQTAAALSYLNNINAIASYTSLQNTLQSSLQNTIQHSFQAEFYRQFLGQSFSSFNHPPPKKQKRGPKPSTSRPAQVTAPIKSSKSFSSVSLPPTTKSVQTPVISALQKSISTPLTPSMGTVLPTLPPSMSTNLASFGAHTSHSSGHSSQPAQAHLNTSSVNSAVHTKPPQPHQQVSPGKTLQEKLAERQKHLPAPKNTIQDINASISRLPSSLTITKTSVPKQPHHHVKKPEPKKTLFNDSERPKPITSDEVIVLDDD